MMVPRRSTPPQRLDRLDARGQARALDRLLQLVLQAPEPFVFLGHGAEVLLEDDLWGGRGAHDVGEPAQRRRALARPAFVADGLPQSPR